MLKSFIEVGPDSSFPIQNLPYGVFRTTKSPQPQIGVAIGDSILNLSYLEREGILKYDEPFFQAKTLNKFMAAGPKTWSAVRSAIEVLLTKGDQTLKTRWLDKTSGCFVAQNDAAMLMPADIGDYTDFYSSKEHATNVGMMFRDKNNPLLPNWTSLPVGYHGRASSVVVSGTDIRRPLGQLKPNDDEPSILAPSARIDFELEMAYFIGVGNDLGRPINIDEALDHVFGLVIMNDWTARDVQRWEYVPLGPFVSKSFATSISPWVVPLAALKPFRCSGPVQEPVPLSYLQEKNAKQAHFDINLSVDLKTKEGESKRLTETNTKHLYWSIGQQVAHHTSTGCNLRPGDLMASGTISSKTSFGSLLEITWGGQNPVALANGNTRKFLADGDEVMMSAYCQGDGYRIGFSQVTGKILPALN